MLLTRVCEVKVERYRRSVSDHTYNYQHQLQTDVCSGQLKPCSGQEVNLEKSNSQVVGDGRQLITYGH